MILGRDLSATTLGEVRDIHRTAWQLAAAPEVASLAITDPLQPHEPRSTIDGLQLDIHNVARWDANINDAAVTLWTTTHNVDPITEINDAIYELAAKWFETSGQPAQTRPRGVGYLHSPEAVYLDWRFFNMGSGPVDQTELLLEHTHLSDLIDFFAAAMKVVRDTEPGLRSTGVTFSQGSDSVYTSTEQAPGYAASHRVQTNFNHISFNAAYRTVDGTDILTELSYNGGDEFTMKQLSTIAYGAGRLLSMYGEIELA